MNDIRNGFYDRRIIPSNSYLKENALMSLIIFERSVTTSVEKSYVSVYLGIIK